MTKMGKMRVLKDRGKRKQTPWRENYIFVHVRLSGMWNVG